MKTVDVLYFVEHVSRELDVACIVKYLCETRYGLSVKIASLPLEINAIIHQYQPNIVVVPYCYSEQSWGISSITRHWKGLTYLNLNYEQFFSEVNRRFKAPADSFARNEVFQHAWSESFKDYLVKCGVKESNIFVNGNPSLMLYQEPYRRYFPTRSELAERRGLNERKLWLFFPENYGWAFLTDSQLKSYIREGYDPGIAYQNREFNRKSLKEVTRWFNNISENQDLEIIVRPRPAVTETEYIREFERELGEIPRSIHIIKEGSIREWNLAADIVVSSFSTSLLEAAVADKPTYILEPYAFPEWLKADWYEMMPHIISLDMLERICHQSPDPSSSQRAKEYVVRTNLSNGDAIANIAHIINDLRQARNSPAEYILPEPQLSTLIMGSLRYAKIRTIRKFKTILSQIFPTTEDNKVEPNFFEKDRFTQEDIEKRVRLWSLVLGKAWAND